MTLITITIMRTTMKISKSEVMSWAWRIFRGTSRYSYSFAESLRRAWEVEKENAAYRAGQVIEAEWKAVYDNRRTSVKSSFNPDMMMAYYSQSGKYVGD